MKVETKLVGKFTTELIWTQAGRIRREQFAGRSVEEMLAHVDARIREIVGRREK